MQTDSTDAPVITTDEQCNAAIARCGEIDRSLAAIEQAPPMRKRPARCRLNAWR
jgi:hypothetical protein